jgi:DNA-binding MarR family transcriptional regulator
VTESAYDAPERSPGFLLWRVTLSWQRRMRAALAPHDLTHVQFVLLASLWWLQEHGGGPPTQAQLAEQAGTDLMTTSQVARKLADRQLLAREADPAGCT